MSRPNQTFPPLDKLSPNDFATLKSVSLDNLVVRDVEVWEDDWDFCVGAEINVVMVARR